MPETIGTYRLDRSLSSGVWGTLFTGSGPGADVLVAVGSGEPDERFEHDVRAAAALSHPTLARIKEHGVEKNPYVVYEPLDATTLETLIEDEGPIEPRRALRMMVQVLQALEHAHDAGLAHGNLDPSAVLIRDGDRVTVIALGLTSRADPRGDVRMAGSLLGHMLGPKRPERLDEVVSGAERGTGVYATARGMRRVLEEVRVEIAPPDVEGSDSEVDETTVWPIPGSRYDPNRLGRRVIVAIVAIALVAGAAFLWRVSERAEELRQQRRESPSPTATTSGGNPNASAGVSVAESGGVRGTLARPGQHGTRRRSGLGSQAGSPGHRRPDETLRRSFTYLPAARG